MAQMPSGQDLIEPLNERSSEGEWMMRAVKNWNVQGGNAQCTDDNYACVGVFTDATFSGDGPNSFLLTITATSPLDAARIVVVEEDYPSKKNNFLKADADYGIFERTKNDSIGRTTSGVYNLGVALNGNVFVNGNQTQTGQENFIHRGQFAVRIDIQDNQAIFRSPHLGGRSWGNRRIQEQITTNKNLRLGVVAPQGFSFNLSVIESRFTLRDEMPLDINMDLNLERLQVLAKKRCKKVVKKIRAVTEVTPINLVVIGEYGSGKSAFINLLLTLFSNDRRPKTEALVTQDTGDQGTRYIVAHTPRKTHLRLVDTIGMSATEGQSGQMNYDQELLGDLLRGNINEGFSWENLIAETVEIRGPAFRVRQEFARQVEEKDGGTEGNPQGYLTTEQLDIDTMNHGAFVVTSCLSNKTKKTAFKMIKLFRSHNDGYPTVGVVTSLDKITPDFRIDGPRGMYHNADVSEAFDKARKRIGMEAFPVRCYTPMENRRNVLFNLLAAEVIDALFSQAVDYKRRIAVQRGIDIEIPDIAESSSDDDDDDEYTNLD